MNKIDETVSTAGTLCCWHLTEARRHATSKIRISGSQAGTTAAVNARNEGVQDSKKRAFFMGRCRRAANNTGLVSDGCAFLQVAVSTDGEGKRRWPKHGSKQRGSQ
jgi:hypothetical protein